MSVLTDFLVLLALCCRITALHEDRDTSFCSRTESGEAEAENVLQGIVNGCFGDAFHTRVPDINMCDDQGRLHCKAIKNVLSIIPSCHYCDQTAANKETCFVRQKQHTGCSVNNLLSKIHCVKRHGKCERQIYPHSSQSFHDVTTLEQTTMVIPRETSSANEYAESDFYKNKGYKKYDKDDCEPCECYQSEEKTEVSVGVAVGLLLLGVVIGTVVTAVICICVPSLHSRASIFRGKVTERFQKPRSQNNTCQAQHDMDATVTDSTLPVETTISYPVFPTAPVSSAGSNQARYHTLNTVANNRDSHTYSGLKHDSPDYFEPMGGGDKYESPEIQPMKGPNTVVSPVYQEFTDNVIPSTEGNTSKHNVDGHNQNSMTGNQSVGSTDTNETSSHNYFVLEDEKNVSNLNVSDNERPLSDHQYFVLEEQNGYQASKDETDPNHHEYFVLEKGQT